MGSGNSTRRVTIVNEGDNVLKLSESVVERIRESVDNDRSVTPQNRQSTSPSSGYVQDEPQYVSQSPVNSGAYLTMDSLRLRQAHQEELEAIKNHYRSKIEFLEKTNRGLYDASLSKLEKKSNQVEEKFISSHRHEPVCVEAQRNVEYCFNVNQSMPLKCSKVAKEFINCMDGVRRQLINEAA